MSSHYHLLILTPKDNLSGANASKVRLDGDRFRVCPQPVTTRPVTSCRDEKTTSEKPVTAKAHLKNKKFPEIGTFLSLEIRKCHADDLEAILAIINDAARAYKGIIPDDRWHEPYMSQAHLTQELRDGVFFRGAAADKKLLGVMGIQAKGEVYLIRHAYIGTAQRRKGIGTALLRHLEKMTTKPILIQ